MAWNGWIRQRFGSRGKRPVSRKKQRHDRSKIVLETLEDRTMPSVSPVTVLSTGYGTPATATSNGQSEISPTGAISSNGRYTVFMSTGTNLVNGQTPSVGSSTINVYLSDNVLGTTTLITHAAGASSETANGSSFNAVISADGSTVVFYSTAANLISGDTVSSGTVQLYSYSTSTGVLTLVSNLAGSSTTGSNGANPAVPPSGTPNYVNTLAYSTGSAAYGVDLYGLALPGVSTNGEYITYLDDATNLVAGETNLSLSGSYYTNVYLYDANPSDAAFGTNTLVSHAYNSATTSASGSNGAWATTTAISADGSTIAFTDPGTNLVANLASGTVGTSDNLYVWSRINDPATGLSAGQTVLASHQASNSLAGASFSSSFSLTGYSEDSPASLSANGTEIAYYYAGENLVTGETIPSKGAATENVFLYNTATNTNTLVSYQPGSPSTTGNGAEPECPGPDLRSVRADRPPDHA